jgi:DNA-binding MarR family transcriptional regulator
MERKERVVYSEMTRTVDYETGVINEEEERKVIKLPQEPPYVKMYIEDLAAVLNLPIGVRGLLYALVLRIDYDGIITLGSTSKKKIAERLKITVGTFDNYLTKLVKAGVLRRIGRGEFEVNPHLFARGDWAEVRRRRDNFGKTFRMTITYSPTGKRKIEGKTLEE